VVNERLKCSIGVHHWTSRGGKSDVTCFRCGVSKPHGPTLRCRVGLHRWVGVRRGSETIRECFFCLKYGGVPNVLVNPPSGGNAVGGGGGGFGDGGGGGGGG
jgi:hypothetical protein